MRKALFLLAIITISTGSFAQNENYQEDHEIKTLMGQGNAVGVYGGMSMEYSQIDDRDAFVFGARGGMLLGHVVGIGIAGSGFFNESRYDPALGRDLNLAGGYGGFFFEPILMPMMPVHVSFPVIVGAGGIAVLSKTQENKFWEENLHAEASDAFVIIQPGIEVELNVTRFFRFSVGGYYRYTSDVEIDNSVDYQLPTDVLRGFSAGVAFKFGKF